MKALSVFFNRKSESEPTSGDAAQSSKTDTNPGAKAGGKGRPTPTRREAEAAAKARAKVPRTRKEISAANKRARQESNAKAREAMRGGDERYLPARDRGPMRRFIRDWVDHRLMFLEMLIPGLLISMVLGYSGKPNLVSIGSSITFGLLLLGIVDIVLTRIRLRRELARRFPGESTRGTIYYAVMRAMQIRVLRLPKRQVKIGEPLPDRYR